jgi:hypothetical protein
MDDDNSSYIFLLNDNTNKHHSKNFDRTIAHRRKYLAANGSYFAFPDR